MLDAAHHVLCLSLGELDLVGRLEERAQTLELWDSCQLFCWGGGGISCSTSYFQLKLALCWGLCWELGWGMGWGRGGVGGGRWGEGSGERGERGWGRWGGGCGGGCGEEGV